MTSKCYRERGIALVLVVWMIAALSVLVSGMVSLSRYEVSVTSAHLTSSKAFYLGKGVARLAMLDRALSLRAPDGAQTDPDTRGAMPVFTARYQVDGVSVFVKILPADGFMSLAGSSAETWGVYLERVGGMNPSSVIKLVEALESVYQEAGEVAAINSATSFSGYQYAYRRGGLGGQIFYVENLLEVEGITRELYDKVRRGISPVPGPPIPDSRLAPDEIRLAFEGLGVGSENGSSMSAYFCVDMEFLLSDSQHLFQRVWVESAGATRGAIRLVRAERPVWAQAVTTGENA